MLSMALCDDNELELNLLKDNIAQYLIDRQLAAKISTFSNSNDLNGIFDIYILDIVMPNKNGIDLGKEIRSRDKKGKIIYYSGDNSYAAEAYNVKATHYLLKDASYEKLATILDEIRYEIRQESIIIKTANGEQREEINNLLYIDIGRRCLCYHLLDGTIADGQTLRTSFSKALAGLINNDNFIYIAPSLLININNIHQLNKDNIVFKNKTVLYFPKSAYEKIRTQWIQYFK